MWLAHCDGMEDSPAFLQVHMKKYLRLLLTPLFSHSLSGAKMEVIYDTARRWLRKQYISRLIVFVFPFSILWHSRISKFPNTLFLFLVFAHS
jgi:hypothetical protein